MAKLLNLQITDEERRASAPPKPDPLVWQKLIDDDMNEGGPQEESTGLKPSTSHDSIESQAVDSVVPPEEQKTEQQRVRSSPLLIM